MPAINSVRKSTIFAVLKYVLQTTQNWSFDVVVWQSTAKKCTKIYNTRAQLLFCSLNGDGNGNATEQRFNEHNNGCARAF